MAISVASVTTTYNGVRMLGRHIDRLLAQSRPLDEIVIIDDCSPDETSTFLAERYPRESYPQIKVLHLERNSGTAGAWGAGLAYAALERKHDWVLSFDQDSVPEPDMLETMLESAGTLLSDQTVGMLASIPVEPETGVHHFPKVFQPGSWLRGVGAAPPLATAQQPLWNADIVITSGSMMRREVVERIGLPRADFYIDFIDTEYSLRARSAGFRIVAVSGCEMSHTIGNTKKARLFGRVHHWTQQPPWRMYYIARNSTYSAFRMPRLGVGKIAVARELCRDAVLLSVCGEHRIACFVKILQGVLDGVRGRLGIRFRPRAYAR